MCSRRRSQSRSEATVINESDTTDAAAVRASTGLTALGGVGSVAGDGQSSYFHCWLICPVRHQDDMAQLLVQTGTLFTFMMKRRAGTWTPKLV